MAYPTQRGPRPIQGGPWAKRGGMPWAYRALGPLLKTLKHLNTKENFRSRIRTPKLDLDL
jgi:hypothetical protein